MPTPIIPCKELKENLINYKRRKVIFTSNPMGPVLAIECGKNIYKKFKWSIRNLSGFEHMKFGKKNIKKSKVLENFNVCKKKLYQDNF